MSRFLKTVLLALVIVGGLWILLNQQQIQQAGGLSNYLALCMGGPRGISSLTSGWPSGNWQPESWTGNTPQLSKNNSVWQSSKQQSLQFTRKRSGSRPDFSAPTRENALRGSMQKVPFQLTSQPRYSAVGLPPRSSGKIRIASFKMNNQFDDTAQLHTLEMLTDLCSQFDILAFQEINPRSISWLEHIGKNAAARSGGRIKFRAISDMAKVSPGNPLFVILYDSATLELDFAQWYSVNDPDELLSREPLVGWFRTRGVASEKAFTFTLANIQLDKHRPDLELAYLGELFRAIRQDGRGEDDVIITGNFNAGDRGLSAMRKRAGLTWVVYDMATSTDKESQFDNLVFAQNATVEFTGQGGVFDFLSAYNLSLTDANSVSSHMPVWAEFSILEGDRQPVPTYQQNRPHHSDSTSANTNRRSF